MTIAKTNSVRKGETIIDEIKSVVGNWKYYARKVNVNKDLLELINKTLVALK